MAAIRKAANSINFTRGAVESFTCPADKTEAFLWDAKTPGLGLRAYKAGSVVYLYQSRLNGQTVRVRIGSRDAWDIDKARIEARRLQSMVDGGVDPRDDRKRKDEAREVAKIVRLRESVTVGEAWEEYVLTHGVGWGVYHRRDHEQAVQVPNQPRKRSKLLTTAGTIYPLLGLRLADLKPATLSQWMEKQTKVRPTKAALGYRLFRAFLNWCESEDNYRGLADPADLLNRSVRKKVAPAQAKKDALEHGMLKSWFDALRISVDIVTAAYFEAILLTGARPGEVVVLRWKDIDFQWNTIQIRDKVEGTRTIPLTPYLAQRLAALPRRNEWVFSSATSTSGHLSDAHNAHTRAIKVAGLPHVTLHGLRRSFGSLAEWVECPVGVVAQIQGHKASAIAEKHYRVRPMDLLRMWHTKIEGWILEQAGINQPTIGQATGLRVVV